MKNMIITVLLSLSTIAIAETTTVLTPEGDIIVCTVNENGVIICL